VTGRLLVRGGTVLTMGRANFPEADVLCDGGVIVEVGPGIRARDAEVLDASDAIVMPGFVDAHRHAWESLFRNQGNGDHRSGISALYEADDVYAATLASLLAALDGGITTLVDWCEVAITESRVEAALEAHADAGIRSVFVLGKSGEPEEWSASLKRLQARPPSRLRSVAAGAADIDGASADFAVDSSVAREHGLAIHAHAGAAGAQAGVIAELAAREVLRNDVTLIHCTSLGDSDLAAVASSGAKVAITPQSEMASGMGFPPLQKLIDRGIRPGLGVDSEAIASGDLFAQMRAAISLQHAVLFDQKLAGKAGVPRLMTTREVLRFATVDGARVSGLGAHVGSLEPGKAADLIVLRTDRPNIFPINDPIGAVVWGMDTSNIEWVVVDGKPMKRSGQLVGKTAEARQLAIDARARVGQAAGLLAGAGGNK
jgi:cytosine/adenosine deaminase-related metal-dependent hydrolase